METQFERFKDAPWFNKDTPEQVIIGGAGGIGSYLAYFLTRAGFMPTIYDFDIIEPHNLGGQLFNKKQIGQTKVEAISNMIEIYCDIIVNTYAEKIDQNTPHHHFMFSAFDNMEARKNMFEVWKRSWVNSPVAPIFIDGRLEFETLQIFCVTPATAPEYEATALFEDSLVSEGPCTLKQTSHSAGLIASLMTAFFTNHIANIYERLNIREIPYFYEFFIPSAN